MSGGAGPVDGRAGLVSGRTGPLHSVRVVEIASIGPGPYAGMLLADLGAEVVRVERPGTDVWAPAHRVLTRGRRSVAVDLKADGAADVVLRLAARADVVIEGFRPGVAERLGIGPEPCRAVNRRLVYGRMTGWGQDGPLAHTAGHDLTYLALSGALRAFGPAGAPPVPPLNLLGDFGAGGMMLAFGVVAAVLEARTSGEGQVVDAAILDGTVSLLGMMLGMRSAGLWSDERESNLLDGGAPFYAVYECADGEYVAVGALEEPFYREFVDGLRTGPGDEPPPREDVSQWPALREWIGTRFAARSRDEWAEVFASSDACVAPVLSATEAARHPHVAARGSYLAEGAGMAPAPVPRFSRTPGRAGTPGTAGADTVAVLSEAGYGEAEIRALRDAGVVATAG